MTDDNYMNAIREAENLLNELLNDPDHGKLTFRGLRGLYDLTITGPEQLDALISGTVLATRDTHEWMGVVRGEQRYWQNFRAGKLVTSEGLYLLALKEPSSLSYCHKGI